MVLMKMDCPNRSADRPCGPDCPICSGTGDVNQDVTPTGEWVAAILGVAILANMAVLALGWF